MCDTMKGVRQQTIPLSVLARKQRKGLDSRPEVD